MKAVVYGGADRQSRSAGEVVPLDDLQGFLDRFEAEPEIAEFVKDRMAPAPSRADIDTLDSVYRRHIRPTLDVLDITLRERFAPLFRHHNSVSLFRFGNTTVSGGHFLESRNWERTKTEQITKPGFTLSNERPQRITHEYKFAGYNGPGSRDFGISVSLVWSLKAEEFSRMATVNDISIPKFEFRVRYSELEARSARIDGAVSIIENGIMVEINKLSGVQ